MRTFHKYSLSCTGRGSSRGSRGSSHNLMSKSNSTTVTRERCELCGSSLCNLIDVHFERKYNQSKRFYYARDIDDLLSNHHTPTTVLTKDLLQLEHPDECLKKYRPTCEYRQRLETCCEYFKYYKDLPRYPMQEEGSVIRKHYEAHRILEYNKLKHVLKLEDEVFAATPKKPTLGSLCVLGEVDTTVNGTRRHEESSMLDSLRMQLSQLIRNIDLGGKPNSKQRESVRKSSNLPIATKRRCSMPDCSQISEIRVSKPKHTKKAISQQSRQMTINNWTGKPKISKLKTTTSPLKLSRTIKNSRNLRSECSQEKSRLRTYKRSIQTLESNYESNKLSSTKTSPHNISHLPMKEFSKIPSSRKSAANIGQRGSVSRVANMASTAHMHDNPIYRKLEIYCPKNPIQIAISNNNCISIFLQQKKSQAGSNPFKKKTVR